MYEPGMDGPGREQQTMETMRDDHDARMAFLSDWLAD
jgi:hypothetical protein